MKIHCKSYLHNSMNILLYLRIVLIHCIKFDHKDLEKSEILTEEIKLQSSKRGRERGGGGGGIKILTEKSKKVRIPKCKK